MPIALIRSFELQSTTDAINMGLITEISRKMEESASASDDHHPLVSHHPVVADDNRAMVATCLRPSMPPVFMLRASSDPRPRKDQPYRLRLMPIYVFANQEPEE